ncbi:MAG: ABC-three component system protein, partial [Hydrogenophaga sp.]|nr:ABC-three component system protein [Hydrogenophaga sp.]
GTSEVSKLRVDDSVLASKLRPGDLPGTCHHLVNRGQLSWVK